VKVRFDAAACTGHGRCYALAPELFDADDQGHCVALGHEGAEDWEVVEVDPTLEAQARLAVANCPEDALRLE
jgi:ferredoxin